MFINIFLSVFFLTGCTNNSTLKKVNNTKNIEFKISDKETIDSLSFFYKNHLKDQYNLCKSSFSKKYNRFFIEGLAKSFKNPVFLKVIDASELSVILKSAGKQDDFCFKITKFDFGNPKYATSAFNSLKKYKSLTLYFKVMNWVWVKQRGEIYLISAFNYETKSIEIQSIKNKLITFLKTKSKDVKSLSFFL